MSETTFAYEQTQSMPEGTLNYWHYYNLKQSPFEDYPQFAMYYPIAHRQAHLKYLQQFCFGSQPLLIIQGEFGIGKSMLLAQFLTQLSNSITSYQIKGRATITAAQLIAEIAQGFQLPLALIQPTVSEQMDAELATLQQLQKTCLLVIDDADLLPTETLATLIHLATAQNQQRICLYILLTCELDLQNHLENIAKEQGHLVYFPTLSLTPLTLEETKSYLKHRLSKAGGMDKIPFTKEMVAHIYDLSAGVPGRINRVAQQTLIDLLKPSEQRVSKIKLDKQQSPAFWNKYFRIMPLIIVLFIIAGIISFKLEKPLRPKMTGATTVPLALPNQKKVAPPDFVVVPANSVPKNPQQLRQAEAEVFNGDTSPAPMNNTSDNSASVNPLPMNAAPTSVMQNNQPAAPAVKTNASLPITNAPTTTTTATAPNSAVMTTSAVTNANTIKPALTTAKVAMANTDGVKEIAKTAPRQNTISISSAKNKTYTAAERKLLTMQGYTLQFLGSRNVTDLNRLLVAHKSLAKNALRFETNYQGKAWHVLVYGNYSTSQAAKLALNQLPKSVRALHPWVRPMSSVHNAIKDKQ